MLLRGYNGKRPQGLPRAAPLNVSGLGTDNRDPFLHGLGDELRSVVGPDVSGNAPQDEEVGQNVDHIDRLELAGDKVDPLARQVGKQRSSWAPRAIASRSAPSDSAKPRSSAPLCRRQSSA
jgi:hypothetical protein